MQLKTGGRQLALLYLDLDHFKNVNDHLGHPTGDLLIVALSRILAELAPDDVVARLGGDEFVLLLPNTTALQAQRMAADSSLARQWGVVTWAYPPAFDSLVTDAADSLGYVGPDPAGRALARGSTLGGPSLGRGGGAASFRRPGSTLAGPPA